MAQEIGLSIEKMGALDAEKLVQLVLDEAEVNADFRKRVTALVNAKGPDTLAARIDRRLSVLERAQARVGVEKERELAADLHAMVQMIVNNLADLDPALALQRLLRFISTHAYVFFRIDESDSRIPDIYGLAVEAVPKLINKMSPLDRAEAPKWLTSGLSHDTRGFSVRAAVAAAAVLPEPVLADWDQTLERLQGTKVSAVSVRQAIADARGDIDGYLVLEELHPEAWQNPLPVAKKLLVANRLEEALAWARREMVGHAAFDYDVRQADLEARILKAINDRPTEGIKSSAID